MELPKDVRDVYKTIESKRAYDVVTHKDSWQIIAESVKKENYRPTEINKYGRLSRSIVFQILFFQGATVIIIEGNLNVQNSPTIGIFT